MNMDGPSDTRSQQGGSQRGSQYGGSARGTPQGSPRGSEQGSRAGGSQRGSPQDGSQPGGTRSRAGSAVGPPPATGPQTQFPPGQGYDPAFGEDELDERFRKSLPVRVDLPPEAFIRVSILAPSLVCTAEDANPGEGISNVALCHAAGCQHQGQADQGSSEPVPYHRHQLPQDLAIRRKLLRPRAPPSPCSLETI